MNTKQIDYIIEQLRKKNVFFDDGLSDSEVTEVETKFGFSFPPDIKTFLQTALPASGGFVNWRLACRYDKETKRVFERLDFPLEGILFTIKSNNYWIDSWGKMPDNSDDKVSVVKSYYQTYPKLIPIYSHRYIPAEPCKNGSPVFSVYGMDIIYYGYDLATYFRNEFRIPLSDLFQIPHKPINEINFWSWCAEN